MIRDSSNGVHKLMFDLAIVNTHVVTVTLVWHDSRYICVENNVLIYKGILSYTWLNTGHIPHIIDS